MIIVLFIPIIILIIALRQTRSQRDVSAPLPDRTDIMMIMIIVVIIIISIIIIVKHIYIYIYIIIIIIIIPRASRRGEKRTWPTLRLRPISLLGLSLLRFVDSKLPGNPLRT